MYSYAVIALASLAAAQAPASSAVAGSSAAASTAAMTAAPAIPTEITDTQQSALMAAFSSYNSGLQVNSYVHSLGGAINTWLPIGSWDNWNAQGFATQTASTNYLNIATGTPTYSYPDWATGLPGSLQSEWGAFASSVQIAHVSIVRSVLDLTQAGLPAATVGVNQGPTPTANNITVNTVQGQAVQTRGPAALAAAAGALGLAALVL